MNKKEKASEWHRPYIASATAKRFSSTPMITRLPRVMWNSDRGQTATRVHHLVMHFVTFATCVMEADDQTEQEEQT